MIKTNQYRSKLPLIFFLVFLGIISYAQKYGDKANYLVDSLEIGKLSAENRELIESAIKCYKDAKHDTIRINCIITIAEQCSDDVVWPKYNRLVLSMAKKYLLQKGLKREELINYKACMAGALNNEGYICIATGNYIKGEELIQQALKLFEEIDDKKQMSVVLSGLGVTYQNLGDLKKATQYIEKALKIQKEIGYEKGYATSLNNMGMCYQNKGDYKQAIEKYEECLPVLLKLKELTGASQVISNIAYVSEIQGNIPLAIDYNLKSLKMREQIGDKHGQAQSLNNLAVIYVNMNETEKALENYAKCLKLANEINDIQMVCKVSYNMGRIYYDRNDFITAKAYYKKGLEIAEKISDKHSVAQGFEYMAILCRLDKKFIEATEWLKKALSICKETEDKKLESSILISLARVHFDLNNKSAAYENAHQAFIISKQIGNIVTLSDAARILAKLEKEKNNIADAYNYLQMHYTLNDSINNVTNRKAAIRSQFQYEFDRKSVADSIRNVEKNKLKDAQLLAQQSKLKQEKTTRIALFGGLFLVLIVAIFMFNRFKVTQAQKKIIEKQKLLVEEKQQEVVDSLSYAKRLQQAIMPSQNQLNEICPENFILNQPKAIVAGDFYWMHTSHSNGNNSPAEIYVAVADCTGHGVPGALVSVVCSNALNRSVNEFGLRDPGKILDKTRELILETFSQSNDTVKDGMDISLVKISPIQLSDYSQVLWAGANNPLWLISSLPSENAALNKIMENESAYFYEMKADKQPVGQYYKPKPFTTHELRVMKADLLYLFTDGYADQFGGEQGKKFKYKQLQKIIFENHLFSMAQQSEILNDKFEKWMGTLEQIDDICIMGIKIG